MLTIARIESAARPARVDTVYAAISARPHSVRGLTVVSSSAAPLPTSMKSVWQASTVRGPASISLASRLFSLIVRPRMPPAPLHQPTKASAASNSSWLRPGMMELPGSETVPTSIWVSVTPWAVAPLAEPGPHTPTRSPKLPAATGVVPGSGAAVDSVGAAAVVGAACFSEPPHAAPATAEINSTQTARRAVLMALSQSSGVGPRNAIARGPARPTPGQEGCRPIPPSSSSIPVSVRSVCRDRQRSICWATASTTEGSTTVVAQPASAATSKQRHDPSPNWT
ncbi:unannotated protein [freshwater metagenome]|uniref:Unannotated protein n=1 Tax=freshwater metagenome TaxID=449393 RepID=A0A6J6QC33_9ZZZZ